MTLEEQYNKTQPCWAGCHNSGLVESLMFFMDTLLGPPPQKTQTTVSIYGSAKGTLSPL